MRIFSNFDTALRQTTFIEYQEKYGIDNVICFWRSRLYEFYRVIFPLLGLLLFTIFGFMFFYRRLSGDYSSYIVIVIAIVDIMFLFPIIRKYLDYKMDFIIVIPNAIMMYDQWGLFERDIITISTQSIKAISIIKSGLLYSIFNNGDIVILTEGDSEQRWEIKLHRIPKPDKRKDQMVKIIGMEDSQMSIPN